MSQIRPHTLSQDRYTSFKGMNCDARAGAVIDRALPLMERPQWTNAFWEQFRTKVAAARDACAPAGTPDVLYLVCSHVFYLRDLFEDAGDAEGEALLEMIEHDCC